MDNSRSKDAEDEDGTDADADYGSNTNGNSQARRAAASDLATAASRKHAPLSYVCGVFVNHHYKYIFIRNRKTASSTFITAVRDFMLREKLCNKTADALHPSACLVRLDPDQLLREGRDPDAMWRDYLVLSSSRNPWARAASGYEFTFEKWHQTRAGCAKPTFKQFCRWGARANRFARGACVWRRTCSGLAGAEAGGLGGRTAQPAPRGSVGGSSQLSATVLVLSEARHSLGDALPRVGLAACLARRPRLGQVWHKGSPNYHRPAPRTTLLTPETQNPKPTTGTPTLWARYPTCFSAWGTVRAWARSTRGTGTLTTTTWSQRPCA